MVKDYSNLTIEEIDRLIEENDKKLKHIWDTDDGNSWEKYKAKCKPYWDDNEDLYIARSMKETPKMRPLEEWEKECLMTIEEFKECCEYGSITEDDGSGKYAMENEVSNIDASPIAFVEGRIIPRFTHVCWYNK